MGRGGRGRGRAGNGGSRGKDGGRNIFWVRKSKSDTVATVTGVGEDAEVGLEAGPAGGCWKKLSSSREEMLERGPASSCMGSAAPPARSSEECAAQTAMLKSKDWADRPLLPGVKT